MDTKKNSVRSSKTDDAKKVNKKVKNDRKRKVKCTKNAKTLKRLKPLEDSDDDQEMTMTMTQGNEVYLTIKTKSGNKKIFKGKYDQTG